LKFFDFDKLIETLTNYLETKLEIFKIDLKEEIGAIIAKVFVYLSMVLLGIVAVIFGLGAFGAWINVQLESAYLGYLINFGIIMLALIFINYNKKKLVKSILKNVKNAEKGEESTNE